MGVTLRYQGPANPGYDTDGEWVDDLGIESPLAPGRRLTGGDAFTADDWELVEQDPDDPAGYQPDAILVEGPRGQRYALPRSLWAADGERQTTATIGVILDRVAGDPDRARAELAAEEARGDKARKTLLEQLQKVIDDGGGQPADNDGGVAAQGE